MDQNAPMRRRWIGMAIALVIGLAIGLIAGAGGIWLVTRDNGVLAGSILPSSLRDVEKLEGTPLTVNLPRGVLEFIVADPVDEVLYVPELDYGHAEAADGVSLIGIGWSYRPAPWGLPRTNALTEKTPSPSAALVVADRPYDLGPLLSLDDDIVAPAEGAVIFAVPGEPDSLTVDDFDVQVTYDGLTQSINVATGEKDLGAATTLQVGTPPTSPGADCPDLEGDQSSPGLFLDLVCQINSVTSTPYVPGLGWADEGTTWLVVTVQDHVFEYGWNPEPGVDAAVRYDATSEGPRLSIAGVPQVAEIYRDVGATIAATESTSVLRVPASAGTVEVTLTTVYLGSVRYVDPVAFTGYPTNPAFPYTATFQVVV